MKNRKKFVTVFAAAQAVTMGAAVVQAADYTWVSFAGGTYLWSTEANWTSGGPGSPAFPNQPGDSGDVSGAITGGPLNINLSADASISTLTLGATGAALATTIGSTGGKLIFDPASVIVSGGTAGASNVISAPIQLNAAVSVDSTSTNGLTLTGLYQTNGGTMRLTHSTTAGPLNLNGTYQTWDATDPLTGRLVEFGGVAGATINVNGQFVTGDGTSTSNTGGISWNGASAGGGATFTTYNLNVAQPNFAGTSTFGAATLIVKDNQALGTTLIMPAGGYQSHLQSDNDARTIPNNFFFSNGFVVDGPNSLTMSGWMLQGNNRQFINNLAPGKTLTLSGTGNGVSIYIFEAADAGNRTFIIDGTGNTIVNGQIKNDEGPDDTGNYNLTKRGSGTLTLNNTTSTYSGATNVLGGLLIFGAANTWGNTGQDGPGINVQANGSVWYAPGSADAGYASFLSEINPVSVGAFALPASESATNFNFSAAPLDNIASMSIGAQGAVTYTGTVTPGPNGYFWGGMTGVLTLNGNNRMTGANNVTYTNGGSVVVTGTQNYTGVTTLAGPNLISSQVAAATRVAGNTQQNPALPSTTVLEISSIANGGVPSGIGASSNDASNLVFLGGTLRYVGPAADTDRLFSIGTLGGAIDSSGAGALRFTNTTEHSGFGDPARTLTLTGSNADANTIAGKLNNAGNLSVTKSGTGRWVLNGANDYTGTTTVSGGTLVAGNAAAFGNSTLTVTAGRAQLANGFAVAMKVPAMTIGDAGSVDIGNNDLIIDYSGDVGTLVDDTRQHLLAGRLLSTSAGTPAGSRVGYGDNNVLNYTSFGGVDIDNEALLIKFTYAGDSDLNGQVDVADLGRLASNWQTSGPWTSGDFDYSGFIDVADLGLLASNWQNGVGNPLGPSFAEALASVGLGNVAVPEPGACALLGAGVLLLLRRRRLA